MIVKRFSAEGDTNSANKPSMEEIDAKLAKLEEKEKEMKLKELDEKDKVFKRGITGGITGLVTGGAGYGLGYFASRSQKNSKNLAKILGDNPGKLKIGGAVLAGTGLLTTGASIIGHRKIKRKVKKVKENDNTEKKK